ncbi:hypothetical protein Patl1_36978 [Pistacia atlantica]|nr:hypothetical protein Patl1_36978 [Pistacia atlantica]
MAVPSRDQVLSLLAPVSNHGDLAVKLFFKAVAILLLLEKSLKPLVIKIVGPWMPQFPVIELFWERMIEKDIRPGGFAENMVKDIVMGMEVVEEREDERVAVLPGAALGTQMFSAMVANGDEKFGTQRLIFVIERMNGKSVLFDLLVMTGIKMLERKFVLAC